MDAPLHQETATADLITDVVGPASDRSSDVADLARLLTSGIRAWREAWSVEAPDPLASLGPPPLNYDEDEELRRLNYLAAIGSLGLEKADRLVELRLRDRRSRVRPCREFVQENLDPQTSRKWYQFHRP